MRQRLCVIAIVLFTVSGHTQEQSRPVFTLEEVMVPMRDGVRLQTVILRPADQTAPLPILFRRTPYGVPERAPAAIPTNLKELMQDGYILVVQNLRGRFKSEGVFNLSSFVDLADPRATNETTDAYDSVEWLVRHEGVLGIRRQRVADHQAGLGRGVHILEIGDADAHVDIAVDRAIGEVELIGGTANVVAGTTDGDGVSGALGTPSDGRIADVAVCPARR